MDDNKVYILDMNRDQVQALVARINALDLQEDTKAKIKITLRMIAKHFLGEDYFIPKEYAWIKASSKLKNRLTRADLLTRNEVERLKKPQRMRETMLSSA